MYAAAQHGIDVDVEIRVFSQQFQFLVQHLQAFFGDFVRLRVVDADLQELKTRRIQALDAVRHKQISIRDHSRDHSVMANAANDVVELGMQQRLAAADGDNG